MSGFADHFSGQAADYAAYRPGYSDKLFQLLAGHCRLTRLAWDVGTGSGQAAGRLAAYFDEVRATDASAEQLCHVTPHPRITFAQGREDESGLSDQSADLICAAQAAHWFDAPRFHAEVARVLRPGGLLALWAYGLSQVDADVDRLTREFYAELDPWWPPERRHIDACYRSLAFPYPELPTPDLALQAELSAAQFLGYLGTWSALTRARQTGGPDPLARFARGLAAHWPLDDVRPVRWPLFLRWGRRPE